MKIFLDMDGVMVIAKPWVSPQILEDGFPMFESQAVNALNLLLSQSNGSIILTTSHKHRFDLNAWKNIFLKRGVEVKSIERLPENINNLTRKEELFNWLSSNSELSNFLIIDDDKSLNGLPEHYKSNLLLISPMIGLTMADAEKVLETIS